MWVIIEMRTGSIHFNTCVGIGSSSQLLVCMLATSLVTSHGVRGVNFLKIGASVSSEANAGIPVKFSQILSIFEMK